MSFTLDELIDALLMIRIAGNATGEELVCVDESDFHFGEPDGSGTHYLGAAELPGNGLVFLKE